MILGTRINVGIKIAPGAAVPRYQHEGDAGVDLRAMLEGDVTLRPGDRILVDTGLAFEIPVGAEGNIRARSGLCHKQGLFVFEGTVDPAFRGSVKINCINLGQEDVTISPGDRIAQMVFSPVLYADFEVKEELDDTARGTGGFGSSGVK